MCDTADRLKLGAAWEGNHVADVAHARHEQHEALEAQAEAGVRRGAEAAGGASRSGRFLAAVRAGCRSRAPLLNHHAAVGGRAVGEGDAQQVGARRQPGRGQRGSRLARGLGLAEHHPAQPVEQRRLPGRAAGGQRCELVYLTEADSPPSTYQGVITDLFIRDKVEYLRLADGFELRLDALVAVDDKELRSYC